MTVSYRSDAARFYAVTSSWKSVAPKKRGGGSKESKHGRLTAVESLKMKLGLDVWKRTHLLHIMSSVPRRERRVIGPTSEVVEVGKRHVIVVS